MSDFLKLALLGVLCIALAFSSGAAVNYVVNLTDKNSALCKAENENHKTWVKMLGFFETRTLANPNVKDGEKQNIIDFYTGAIAQLPAPIDC